MKKQLEIISASDLNLFIPSLEKPVLTLKGKTYEKVEEWSTPYIVIPKKEEKFHKKMNKIILKKGRKINATKAIIKFTHTHYLDNTANHSVLFYKEN